jgi:hypothetical protein
MGQIHNVRWEAFAQARALQQLSVEESYHAIGGKGVARRNGNKLNAQPVVQARIKELLAERKDKILEQDLYTREEVVQGLLNNARRCDAGAPVFFKGVPCTFKDAEGVEQTAIRRDSMAINRAWELLGIEKGMFPKTTQQLHGKMDPLEGLSLEEILNEMATQIFNETGWKLDLDTLKKALNADDANVAALLGSGEEG